MNTIFITIFLVIIFFELFLYVLLYTWRNMTTSLFSFIYFSINNLLFISFLYSMLNIYLGMPNPIFVEDLSIYSYYRYVFCLTAICLGFFGYYFKPEWYIYLNKYNYPYLKEEIRLFLSTWNETVFGPICSHIMNQCYSSKIFRYLVVFFHICLIYLIRLIQALFFINFVLFHGDLRYCIYLLPLSFVSWILSFFEYYLKIFFEGSVEYMKDILSVTFKTPLNDEELATAKTYIEKDIDEFIFTITPAGYMEGFKNEQNNIGLNSLKDSWIKLNYLKIIYNIYISYIKKLSLLYISLRITSWLIIIFFTSNTTTLHAGFPWGNFFKVGSIRSFSNSATHQAPRQAFFVKKPFQAEVEKSTGGAYKGGHPIVADLDDSMNGSVPIQGQLTHGKGSHENPSKPLSNTTDLKGSNSKGQKIVVPKENCTVNEAHLTPPVSQSKEYFDRPDVKTNMAKHTYKDPENT